MSKNNISIGNLSKVIEKELMNYKESVNHSIKNATDDAIKDLVRRTKNDAKVGKRKGKYKKSISSKILINKENRYIKVWYVKAPEYRLAHLLNNGHASKKGTFVKGDKHISKNEEIAIKNFEKKVENIIKNGY